MPPLPAPLLAKRMNEDLKRDAADAAAETQGRMTPSNLDAAMQDIKDSLGVPSREQKAADLSRLESPVIYPADPRSLGLGGEEDFVRTPETLPAVPPFVLTDATLPQTPTRFPPGHPNIPPPGRRRETGVPARVPFREGMRVPHMNIPFPEGATPERMDLLASLIEGRPLLAASCRNCPRLRAPEEHAFPAKSLPVPVWTPKQSPLWKNKSAERH